AERENSMLVQYQSFALWMRVEDLFGFQRQRKPGHHVGNDSGTCSIDFLAEPHAVRPVAQSENRVGVCMIDEFVRDESVQQRLDRRVRRGAVEQIATLDRNHLLIAERFATGELQQRGKTTRRTTQRLER